MKLGSTIGLEERIDRLTCVIHQGIDTLMGRLNLVKSLGYRVIIGDVDLEHFDADQSQTGIAPDAEFAYGEFAYGYINIREAWNKAYDINVTGTNVMTHTFTPLLLKSSDPRLLFITSGLASTAQMSEAHYPVPPPIPAGWPKNGSCLASAYHASKTALNMMMLSWYWVLKEDGVKVWCISPGFLATGVGGERAALARRGAGHPSTGGKLIIAVKEGKKDADVGKIVSGAGIQEF